MTDCKQEWCTGKIKALGYCATHYQRQRLGLDMEMPIRRWRDPNPGEWYVNKKGYRVRLGSPDESGYRPTESEHREVVASEIGRRLFPDEEVHHKNGDKLDNRIGNLELWSTKQPKGQRVSDKLAWAHEIIERYEGMAL